MAIVYGTPEDAKKAKEVSSCDLEIWADENGAMMDQFGLRDIGGNPFSGEDTARPATLLVSSEGKLLWAKYSSNYRLRMKPGEILSAAKDILSKSSTPTR